MDKEPLLISFLGGRSSAFMAKFILENKNYDKFIKYIVFANTGKENEETLEFIQECDKRWDLGVIWLEAVVHHERNKGTTHKIVDFKTAARDGEPFEEMLKKFGIPNKQFPHCTRELKQRSIKSFMRSLGHSQYYVAKGIRGDEKHRLSLNEDFGIPLYPLANDIVADERSVRMFWDNQDFDLKLKDYEGNCDLCWKKSKRKRLTLIKENPEIANWWSLMERKYNSGMRTSSQNFIFDQREGLTVTEQVELANCPFELVLDKHELRKKQPEFNFEMDYEESCFCKIT